MHTDTDRFASYIDLHLKIDNKGAAKNETLPKR